MSIHSTAIVSPKAALGKNVTVGAFAIIDDDVVIGDNCTIAPRAHIEFTHMGANNYIGEGAMIGAAPQDLKYKGDLTFVRIGSNNVIREYVSIHRAVRLNDETVIGDSNFLLTMVHIGHDCRVGNNNTMINNVGMSGHVVLHDHAVISGYALIHQHVKIGSYVMMGGGTKIVKDVPPFMMIDGNPSKIHGLNKIGLKRNGFSAERIRILEHMYTHFFRNKTLLFADAVKKIEETIPQNEDVKYFLDFLKNSERGVSR
jgi:UDP-N-acetylglucosamine acyltransferase